MRNQLRNNHYEILTSIDLSVGIVYVSEIVVVVVIIEGRLERVVRGQMRHLQIKRSRWIVFADNIQGGHGEEIGRVGTLGAVGWHLVHVHVESRKILRHSNSLVLPPEFQPAI